MWLSSVDIHEGGMPAVPDMQGPRRVRRNELEVDPRRLLRRLAPVILAAAQDRSQLPVVGRCAQVEVDESRTRDLDPVEFIAVADVLDDFTGEISRAAAGRLREPHRPKP